MEKIRKTHFKNGRALLTEEENKRRKLARSRKYWKTYKRKPLTQEQKERQKAYSKKWWIEKGRELRRLKDIRKRKEAQGLAST
ncbi:hypothetical protein [Methylophaga sp.]|uniref:hypothetical protein n=1 Tax=Methylophaga sp. TaxID=2024840 RepID=UPI000C41FB13|nr:hypothetical protein [Methylophaga sp.]MBP23867.1 hypothetical protein [Methylophaga sp.]|tara:strand:+ start:7663 stop:7911 length:249 start_codon:yes stop_codon:yes gene_type:complete